MAKTIAITGATGTIGGLTIPALIEDGAHVKALVRNPEKARDLRAWGVEVVEGDFTDADALRNVMADADSILLIAPPNPDAATQMSAMISAASGSGDPQVVRISALGADADAPTDNGRLHHVSDEELVRSGLPYTIVRPHFFMQNLLLSVETLAEGGQMYWGMGDGRLGMIDARDIADVATRLLLDGGHEGATYTPTGPESISFHEAAEILSATIGREVAYVPVPPEAVKQSILEMGWGEWGAEVMQDYSTAYSEGWGDFVTDDFETVTGQSPRSFAQFVGEVLAPAIG